MLTIGDRFPSFALRAVDGGENKPRFVDLSNRSFAGNWLCVVFYPNDFTFVCPTELLGFAKLDKPFRERDCQILAASIDSEHVHLAWRTHQKELGQLPFPLLADNRRELSQNLGIVDRDTGVSLRATFLVDPNGIIRFVDVTDRNVGRNPAEVLRVLDALQTDELCPCNWKAGDDTLGAA